jgi:hypothetical protein
MKLSGRSEQRRSFTDGQALLLREDDKLFAYVWLDPTDPPRSIELQWYDGTWDHRAFWGDDVAPTEGSRRRRIGPLPSPGAWNRLDVSALAIGLPAGSRITGWSLVQQGGTTYYDRIGVHTLPEDERYRVSQAFWEQRDRGNTKLPAAVKEALEIEPPKRREAQNGIVRDHYIRNVFAGSRGVFDPLNRKSADLKQRLKEIDDGINSVMVSEEMSQRRPAYVLIRGDFQQRGEKVEPDVPAAFPPLPSGSPRDRLALARWLVSPDHPLTARVAVNRLWAQMFGTGLVKTLGDFGTQGEFPSHPDLLDWLASELVASGWDVKRMQRLIATSATYRQSSKIADVRFEIATLQKNLQSAISNLQSIDPENRLLSRAPRYRLSAEEIRDNALAIAGLLSPRIGGPSVMPYQPASFYAGRYEAWKWTESPGDDLYRRGLYTFWRRTSLHPMYAIFDAPSREECTVLRPRTNTPLQALITLNDPTFVEAARVFAQRILLASPPTFDDRLTFAVRTALARAPSSVERAVLAAQYQRLHRHYQADPKAAAELLNVGQFPPPAQLDAAVHAAWTGLANVLLNLDETITRE